MVMMKLNICASRVPGMTHAEFCRYLKDNHARLVLGTQPVARFLSSYVQHHVFDAAYRSNAPSFRYDSVSHITMASIKDQMAAVQTREYKECIAPDELNFADTLATMFLMLQERELQSAIRGPSQFRLLHYMAASAHTSSELLQELWEGAHADVLQENPALQRAIRRAVLHQALPEPFGVPSYSGMCELGFVEMDEVPAFCQYARDVETRLSASIEWDKSFFLLSEAVPVQGSIW
jgi:uncharacterized protein (TIGR02118 family)